MYKAHLVNKDAKNKLRVVNITCDFEDEVFIIRRQTGLYGGNLTEQPEIIIEKGKAKRTLVEQATLEYNSHLNKYLNKGYKLLDKEAGTYTEIELETVAPAEVTDTNGVLKPMLAKDHNKVAVKIFDDKKYEWFGSRKLDGKKSYAVVKSH